MLSDARLIDSGSRGDDELSLALRCGRPLLYPLPAADLPPVLRGRAAATGARYAGALFAFDLDVPPAGHRYAAARFTVDLAGSGVVAVQVHSCGDAFGLLPDGAATAVADRAAGSVRAALLRRLGVRTDRPAARTSGTLSSRFGWHYTDRRATPLLPRTYGGSALIELPPGAAELHGSIEAEVELTGPARRRATSAERIPFTVAAPGAPAGRSAAVRLCMAADISGYSRLGPDAAVQAQQDLVRILATARTAAGVDPSAVAPQPQGDGQFTVLPVGLDEAAALPRLMRSVAEQLAAHNATRSGDRLRLRVALHRGLVREADNGWVGRAAIAVHRILDCAPVRTALSEHRYADYVLGVPDVLYSDVLTTGEFPPPAAFRPVLVDLPAKGFREQAWVYVAGSGA
ncbi:hypothetical protein OHA21_19050 [Actinoplanes sp. NBC_00393]|uniref:hypothetical protein n=1 Tax=Actinoplanes sp. NBC_00393 TaxID=2975953 RepID=UPI002E1C7128